jgi:uncharacterized protein YyaL (SSP411 family)
LLARGIAWRSFALVLAFAGSVRADEPAMPAVLFAQWGGDTLAIIRRDLWLNDQKLYAERARLDRPPRQPAYMWGAGVQLSALAAAAHVDRARYLDRMATYADALDAYWVEHNSTGGYDVQPDQPDPDRYYDDNAWIVMAMLEAHALTDEAKYLDRAKATMCFVLSGEDDRLGGGIYWRENTRDSKNTCSNAPAIVGCLLLHSATGDAEYLATAQRLFAWTEKNLRDDQDGLYLDNVNLAGKIDRRKFTYNSALMIRANCLLYEATGEAKYQAEAERMAEAAALRWIDVETGAIRDAGRFAHMLLEALAAVDRSTGKSRWREITQRCVTYVHTNLRDSRGHYGPRWDRPPTEPWRRFELLDQASAARAYFHAAAAGEAIPGND